LQTCGCSDKQAYRCIPDEKVRCTIELRLSLLSFGAPARKTVFSLLNEPLSLPFSPSIASFISKKLLACKKPLTASRAILSQAQPQFYGTSYFLVKMALIGRLRWRVSWEKGVVFKCGCQGIRKWLAIPPCPKRNGSQLLAVKPNRDRPIIYQATYSVYLAGRLTG